MSVSDGSISHHGVADHMFSTSVSDKPKVHPPKRGAWITNGLPEIKQALSADERKALQNGLYVAQTE